VTSAFTIRELDRKTDRRGVEAIDTAFETTSVFDVVTTDRSIELVERPLEKPLVKRYSIAEVFAGWARWDAGWVAMQAASAASRRWSTSRGTRVSCCRSCTSHPDSPLKGRADSAGAHICKVAHLPS
jgi:hypothetical protein